jgi:hypothetical protein
MAVAGLPSITRTGMVRPSSAFSYAAASTSADQIACSGSMASGSR